MFCSVTKFRLVWCHTNFHLGSTLILFWTMFKKTGSLIKKKVPWIHLCWWGFIEKFSFISGDELSNSYPTDYSLLHFLLKQIWIRNFKFFPGTTWTEIQYTGTKIKLNFILIRFEILLLFKEKTRKNTPFERPGNNPYLCFHILRQNYRLDSLWHLKIA